MLGSFRDEKLDLLAEVPLFDHLSRRELHAVARLLDVVEVPAGRELVREGTVGREFFVIIEGTAAVERDGRPVATVTAGDVVGEMSLLDGGPRSATVVASSDLRLLVGERRTFAPLLDADERVRTRVLEAVTTRQEANAA